MQGQKIKVKPSSAHLEQPEAKKVYEKVGIPIGTLAERVRHVVQSAFDGHRIVIFSAAPRRMTTKRCSMRLAPSATAAASAPLSAATPSSVRRNTP